MDQTQPTIFDQFLAKLKQEKSDEQVGEILAALFQFQSEAVYEVLMQVLTEEDLKVLDAITDDTQAEQEVMKRFELRAGMNMQEFINKIRDSVSSEYLKKP